MRQLAGISLVLTLGFLLTACHPNIDITFENRTDNNVLTQVNNDDFEEVKAGSTVTFTVLTEDVDRFEITVVTEDGDVLFHEVLTEDELEEIGNRIIIEETPS
jgi:hypothetical protein